MKYIFFIFMIGLCPSCLWGQIKKHQSPDKDSIVEKHPFRDLYVDTWVGTDALDRHLPTSVEVGPVKKDHRRIVGIFYVTWHSDDRAIHRQIPYGNDVTKILSADTGARLDATDPHWGKDGDYHWGEPEMGYFLSKDRYVIRKDMSMLADAGVDVLIMDVTNAVRYWDEWSVIFKEMEYMRQQGLKVPKFCFWAFNGPVITVVQDIYDKIYKAEKYKDLWFYWDGRPLLLYNQYWNFDGKGTKNLNLHYDSAALTDKKNPHYLDTNYTQKYYLDYTKEVKKFFTARTMWWGYYKWGNERFVGTENNWSFGYDLGDKPVREMNPDDLVSRYQGKKEEAAVTPAQHPASLVGKSWSRDKEEPPLNEYDLSDSAYVPWLGKTVAHPEGYGIYFQQRWDEAIKADPQFIYLNDWNEWTAGKYQPDNNGTFPFMRRKNPYFFVDQYNAEFNRTIQPMKDGYTDNYYMQMAENIRRYKGVRPVPVLKGLKKINIGGSFNDWNKVTVEYRDASGDTLHRDYKGYGGLHYKNNSGRNDIVTCKVAVGKDEIYFYAETSNLLSSYTGNNWMLLLIDADKNSHTGWFGYDFLINKSIVDDKTTTLMRYDSSVHQWVKIANLNYSYKDKKLGIAIPRSLLKLKKDAFTFDFHWCDNPADLKDPISLSINGDSAPDRCFNYRCIWKK